MTHLPNELQKNITATLRSQFHTYLLPHKPAPLHPVQAQLSLNTLNSIVTRAEILAERAGGKNAAAAHHDALALIGTTPEIIDDLKLYFNQNGQNPALAKQITAQQSLHTRALGLPPYPLPVHRGGFGN